MADNSGQMRVIAVVNQKGGTAKTTTAVSLAVALAELHQRVVLIDLDPQGSATLWLGHSPTTGLADVLSDGQRLDSILEVTKVEGLELVPASKALTNADRVLSGEPGIQTALRTALTTLPPRDFVLIDCQPSLGLLSVMALAAAPEALVPVGAGSMELEGLAELTRTVGKVRDRLNPSLKISAVLACRIDKRGASLTRISAGVLDSLRRHFPAELLDTMIFESTRLKEAPSHHLPISQYDPNGQATKSYRAAAEELLNRRGVLTNA